MPGTRWIAPNDSVKLGAQIAELMYALNEAERMGNFEGYLSAYRRAADALEAVERAGRAKEHTTLALTGEPLTAKDARRIASRVFRARHCERKNTS